MALNDLELPTGLSFGELLHWLLSRGVRPPGSLKQGERWTREDFGDHVGRSEKQVRNWLKDESLPNFDDPVVVTIERIFFGTDQNHRATWRLELRDALRRSKAGGTRTENAPTPTPSGERFAMLEVVLNREQSVNIQIQPARDAGLDTMSLVGKVAELFDYPNYAWLTKSLAAWYSRVEGKPLEFEFPTDDLQWLHSDWWDFLYSHIESYEDGWVWEVMRWYSSAEWTVRRWHNLETIKMRSAAINLTINNIGRASATNTVLEAKIYGDNEQQLHQPAYLSIRGDEVTNLGNNVDYENEWYIDLFPDICQLDDRNELQKYRMAGPKSDVLNINKPVWYGKEDKDAESSNSIAEYDFYMKFNTSIESMDEDWALKFRCEIPSEIVHFDSIDCPGFHVNFFYQDIKHLTIEYRVHSRDQERPTTGKIIIDVVEIEPAATGSDPWINPDHPLKRPYHLFTRL